MTGILSIAQEYVEIHKVGRALRAACPSCHDEFNSLVLDPAMDLATCTNCGFATDADNFAADFQAASGANGKDAEAEEVTGFIRAVSPEELKRIEQGGVAPIDEPLEILEDEPPARVLHESAPAQMVERASFDYAPDVHLSVRDAVHTSAPVADPPPFDDFPPEATQVRPERQSPSHAPQSQPVGPPPLDWNELQQRGEPPPRRWAIQGWLGFGHVTLLVGQGGIGKSLIAQSLASCLAIGRPFIDEIEGRLTCLAWHCEDDHDELWRRQCRIAQWLDTPLSAFEENLILVPRAGINNSLAFTDFGKLTFSYLLEELRDQAAHHRADVVILDNVGQLYGAGENDRHNVTAFLNALVGALPGKAILLLAHPSRGLNSEFSGSSAWENTARSRWYLGATMPGQPKDGHPADDEPNEDVRYLGRRKANYSTKDMRRFQFRNGVLIPDVPDAAEGITGHARRERAETVILQGVQQFYARQIRTQPGPRSPAYLVRMMLEASMTDGVRKSDLAPALARLMADGKLVEQPFGRSADRHPQTTLAVA